jgi:nickel-type superoxide dismutase maturation protease
MRTSQPHYRLVAALLTGAVATVLARRISRVEVEGDSMLPTLLPGDRLVVVRRRRTRPRPGDLVAVPDPRLSLRVMVKRVAEVTPEGVVVRGDNPHASTDSRLFGPVPAPSIRGRVVYRYFPEPRRGRLR